MSKVTLMLALVALALGGFVAFEACERGERLTELEDSVRAVQDSLSHLDGKLDRVLAEGRRADKTFLTADASAPEGGEAGLALSNRTPTASPTERLAALEETVAKQRDTIADMQEKAESRAASGPGHPRMLSFYHNLDAASKAMELNERQKTDMQDVIDGAKRELADLYAIENDAGETWASMRKRSMTTIGGSDGGGIQISMPDFGKIRKFKQGKVPGSAETFGQAEERIQKRAFADMRHDLTPAQAKKWDGARKNGLLGSSSSTSTAVMFEMTTDK